MGENGYSWKDEIWDHRRLILLSVFFFVVAIILNHLANNYTDKKNTVPVSDLILNSIPTVDLTIFFVFGFLIVVLVLLFYPLLFKVRKFHVAVSQFSLLVTIRSFFITLTHLGLPIDSIKYYPKGIYQWFIFQNDLFFSGHVAIAFLGFLLYRKEKIGIFFLIATIVMALTVLFMHVHYSIDVFAAFFITYGSYKIGEQLFKRINGD
jgi:membrane-associated phospholipid phosphatase